MFLNVLMDFLFLKFLLWIMQRVDRSRGNSNRRKTSVGRKKHQHSDHNVGGIMDSVGNNVSLMEVHT